MKIKHSTANIPIIILAAGQASRMGQPKQLLKVDGQSLLERAVATARAASGRLPVVVVGARAELMLRELDKLQVIVTENTDWSSGMGSSVAAGVAAVEQAYPEAEACLIMLADQPLVDTKVLNRLAEAFTGSVRNLVVSAYDRTIGVPAVFSKKHFPELKALRGQKGAKPIFRRYADQLTRVDCPEAAFDLDTPEDWQLFLKNRKT